MKKIAALLVVGILLIVGSAQVSAYKKDKLELRKKISVQWLAAGDEVATATKNEDAIVIMKFLRESAYLSQPTFNAGGLAAKVIQAPTSKRYHLCFVPLLSSDRNVSKHWQEAVDENQSAFFLEGANPLVVLKESGKFSRTWQGLILIHEGGHALMRADGENMLGSTRDPLLRKSIEEFYAYQLETAMVEKLGGQAYQKLLQEEAARLEKSYFKQKIFLMPDYARYYGRLEKIFGRSNSKFEVGVRGSVFWINSVFHLIDTTCKREEREQCKLDFLLSAYKSGSMQ